VAVNWRVAVAFAFIGLMAAALIFLLLRDEEGDPVAAPTTTVVVSTTTSSSTTTSTTVAEATTTSLDPEARLAEVEGILEGLEVAWYDAVYRKDESVLADIVATKSFFDSAVNAMEMAEFTAAPSGESVEVTAYEILLDRTDCLVVHHRPDVSRILSEAAPLDAVQVLWPTGDGTYRLVSRWSSPSDLWIDDCETLNRDEIP